MIEEKTADKGTAFDAPVPAEASVQTYQVRDKPNPRWSTHFASKILTVKRKPLFHTTDTVYAIGSCFAERIRLALGGQGVKVGPFLDRIPMDNEAYRIDSLPARQHMNYYNSFTIRQEFERHIGMWAQSDDDYWALPKDSIWGGKNIYQDPYRRAIFGRTPESLFKAIRFVDLAIDASLPKATTFFITLGMAEVFRNKKSGLIACQKPGYAGGAGEDETEFHMSSFAENYENMSVVADIITSLNPDAQIVMTVSPVGLARTFGEDDIITANTEGKSILRAVLGQLSRERSNVTYFPSYELVMSNAPLGFRSDDGRHVSDWIVGQIVKTFKAAHLVG